MITQSRQGLSIPRLPFVVAHAAVTNDSTGDSTLNMALNVVEFGCLLLSGSLVAGMLGALTGLGGGVVLVPLLTIFFKVDLHYAIGASLVAVIATSSGSAASYVEKGLSNIRVGVFLEMATTLGAVVGAFVAAHAPTRAISMVFGLMLVYTAVVSIRTPLFASANRPSRLATALRLNGSFTDSAGRHEYELSRIPVGFSIMFGAGVLSGLLGIGSGAVKVVAMDQAMRIPFKVSTTTSNFMIGVTAAASAGVYLNRGYIDPVLTMPVMLGILIGSFVGVRILVSATTPNLRVVFSVVIGILGIEMLVKALTGTI